MTLLRLQVNSGIALRVGTGHGLEIRWAGQEEALWEGTQTEKRKGRSHSGSGGRLLGRDMRYVGTRNDTVRKASAQLELQLVEKVKGKKKGFCKYISSRRESKESVGPLLSVAIWKKS